MAKILDGARAQDAWMLQPPGPKKNQRAGGGEQGEGKGSVAKVAQHARINFALLIGCGKGADARCFVGRAWKSQAAPEQGVFIKINSPLLLSPAVFWFPFAEWHA